VLENLKETLIFKKLSKTMLYSRLRQHLPMAEPFFLDDRDRLEPAELVQIEWPEDLKKPFFGIVQNYGIWPNWTKYRRFLENNGFPFELVNIHAHDWIEAVKKYDILIGISSSDYYSLQELRRKYYFIENELGKFCYPSSKHTFLYEDKTLEAYISQAHDLPFVNTYISHDKTDALQLIEKLNYPLVSKVDPSSGSIGVELVRSVKQARKIVKQAFSGAGRKTHLSYSHQKNVVYFQDFIPSDGYDIRVIVLGDWVFGYYRRILRGDFRASGMGQVELRVLPLEPMLIARKVNQVIQSPMLAVDMIKGLDGRYHIIEFSPLFEVNTTSQLRVNDIPGVYIFESDGSYHFEEHRYWIQELALRQFLLKEYLPRAGPQKNTGSG
jgi:glutathione synthase/RimK-type ligase-like ATP-grasp enzyme